jgi:hypothetical protein
MAPLGHPSPLEAPLATPATKRLEGGPPGLSRFHPHAGASTRGGGSKKNGGPDAQALGRSRGGCSTKRPAACTNDKTGVCLLVTSGARHDAPGLALVGHDFPALPARAAAVLGRAMTAMPAGSCLPSRASKRSSQARRLAPKKLFLIKSRIRDARKWRGFSLSSNSFALLPRVMTRSVEPCWPLFTLWRPGL